MKKLIRLIPLSLTVILCFCNCITVFAAEAVLYGKLRTETGDKKAVYADIFIDSNKDLDVGAVLMSFSYDASKLRFISAQLGNKATNDKFEVYCDKNGSVNILYGNARGKTVTGHSTSPFMTLKFRREDASDSFAIGINCRSFVDGEAKEIDISYIDKISFEMNKMLDDPYMTPEKLADSITASRAQSGSGTISVSDREDKDVESENASITESRDSREQQYSYPLVINSESSSVKSMIIGGVIVLCVSALVFWGYRAGISAASDKENVNGKQKDGHGDMVETSAEQTDSSEMSADDKDSG